MNYLIVNYCLKECSMYTIKSCEIYWHIVGKCKTLATCVNAWTERINVTNDQHFWKAVFCLPNNCINDFKVNELRTKIIHRFYPCQSLVSKWDESTSNICNLCNEEVANITHTFFDCIRLNDFWQKVEEWFKKISPDYNVILNCENVLLGIIPYTFKSHSLNHCVMYCKLFIHRERLNTCEPNFKTFLNFYKHVLDIEKDLYTIRNAKNIFDKSFGTMYNDCKNP